MMSQEQKILAKKIVKKLKEKPIQIDELQNIKLLTKQSIEDAHEVIEQFLREKKIFILDGCYYLRGYQLKIF